MTIKPLNWRWLKWKLRLYAWLPAGRKAFGYQHHGFKYCRPIRQADMTAFETEIGVTLPIALRQYYTVVSDGGPGPGCGMLPLADTRYPDDSTQQIIDTQGQFPHAAAWNLAIEDSADFEERYNNPQWIAGTLCIADLGCGVHAIVVLTGAHRGEVWIDSRVNVGGIYPVVRDGKHQQFEAWYRDGLQSLSMPDSSFNAERRD